MDENPQDQFPNLSQLLGAYLNQDFDICGPNLEDAVRAFVDDASSEVITAARADIARFLETKANDLDAELGRLSWDYAHEPSMAAREYLLWLDGLLADGQSRKGGPS
jgi:hypothetical protein